MTTEDLILREFPNDSDNHTAKFECNDDEYIAQFESEDDSGSIHSSCALEASSEFVKNDYISLRNEDERAFSQNYQYNRFYDKSNYTYKVESPQIYSQYQYLSSQNTWFQPCGMQQRKDIIIDNTQNNQKSFCAKPVFSGNEYINMNKRQKIGEDEAEPTLIKKTKSVVVLKNFNETEAKPSANPQQDRFTPEIIPKCLSSEDDSSSHQSRQIVDRIMSQKEKAISDKSADENSSSIEVDWK